MNIVSIINFQRQNTINTQINSDLPKYKLWARKHLELHVKLGSLAEQTNCYSYLATKPFTLDKNFIFKKYIDFLSHIISLGLERDYITNTDITLKPNDYCLSDQFLNLYIDINDLIVSSCSDHFSTLLEDTLSLGVTLGYCENDIINEFIN